MTGSSFLSNEKYDKSIEIILKINAGNKKNIRKTFVKKGDYNEIIKNLLTYIKLSTGMKQ